MSIPRTWEDVQRGETLSDEQLEAGLDNVQTMKPNVDIFDPEAVANRAVENHPVGYTEIAELPDHWATGCSNAKRWVSCPGSKYAEDNDNDLPARMGTLGHKIVHAILLGESFELDDAERADLEGLEDEELAWFKGAVKTCVEYVRGYVNARDDVVLLERKIKSTRIDEHGGTIDVIVFNKLSKMLTVIDFKFGQVPVNAENNYQLKAYINLARQLFPEADLFCGIIIQPRFRGVEASDFTASQLHDFMLDAAVAADPSNMERKAGVEWCEHCPLLFSCKEAAKLTTQARVEFEAVSADVFSGNQNEPSAIDIELMERIAIAHKIAVKAIKGASAILKTWQESGNELNYHKLVVVNTRKWKDDLTPDDMIRKIGNAGLRPVTVTEAQKISGLDKKEFNALFDDQLQYIRTAKLMPGVKPEQNALNEFEPVG